MDKLKRIKLLAMDVDGTLTDGSMMMTPEGDVKAFNVLDGLGIRLAMAAGLDIAWITGNISRAVTLRAESLRISEVQQGARYKSVALHEIAKRKGYSREEVAYVGDDLNDLPAMQAAGVAFAVANAAAEVRVAADFVTERPGGCGAVREVIEAILKAQSRWDEGVREFLNELRREQERGEAPGAVT
ncbi:MAG: HAD hydrolase family protein [Armatimonadetes bacterium]|nr:HAD hydrolase family protein [Armatimonadota bacterium]